MTDKEGDGGFNDLSSERGSARFSPRKFGEGGSGEFLVADAHDGLGGVRYEEGDGVGGFKGFWGGRHLQDRWALEGDGGGMGSRRCGSSEPRMFGTWDVVIGAVLLLFPKSSNLIFWYMSADLISSSNHAPRIGESDPLVRTTSVLTSRVPSGTNVLPC